MNQWTTYFIFLSCRLWPVQTCTMAFHNLCFYYCRMKSSKQLLWNMAKTSGPGLHRCCIGSQPSSARPVGMSGWILVSRRQNGAGKKRRSSSIWPNLCQHSGGPLLLSLVAQQHNAWSTMNTFCEQRIWLHMGRYATFFALMQSNAY